MHYAKWDNAWRCKYFSKQMEFNRQQALARCALSSLVQKFQLARSVYDNQKGVMEDTG